MDFFFSKNDDLLGRVEALFESPVEYAAKISQDKSQSLEHLAHIEESIKNTQPVTKRTTKSIIFKPENNPLELYHQVTHSNIKLSVDLLAKNLQYEFHEKQLREFIDQKEKIIVQNEFHEKQLREFIDQKEIIIVQDKKTILKNKKTISKLEKRLEEKQVSTAKMELEHDQNQKRLVTLYDEISNLHLTISNLNRDLQQLESSKANKEGLILQGDQPLQGFISQVEKLESENRNLNSLLARSQEEIQFYANSRSWKITRPLRKLIQFLRGKRNVQKC